MPRKISIFLLLLATIVSALATDENVVVKSRELTYKLKSKNGKLTGVKVVDATSYEAQRADEEFYAVDFYNEHISIDKASAPKSTPVYRAWTDDDIFYSGARVCVLPMQLKAGKAATVVFEKTYKSPEQFCQILLCTPYKTGTTHLTIHVPADIARDIKFRPVNLPEGAELKYEATPGGNLTYTLTLDSQEPFKQEALAASADVTAPQLLVTGHFKDVGELYSFLKSGVTDEEPSDELRNFAEKICSSATSDRERVEAVTSWVQNNIRYVAVEHGEFGIFPEKADMVLSRRYGDCKGSANLIKTMLRSIGIDGRLVWIGTRNNVAGKWSELSSLAAGNHMIAAAILSDSIAYLDGTASFTSAGQWPSSIAGTECLIEDGGNFIIGTVPEHTAEMNTICMSGEFSIDNKALCGALRETYTGTERSLLENSMASVSAPKRSALLHRILLRNRKSASIDSVSAKTSSPDAPVSEISYVEKDPSAIRSLSGGKYYVMLRPLRAATLPKPDAAKRVHALEMPWKHSIRSSFTLKIPDGFELAKLPDIAEFDNPWFKGGIEYSTADAGREIICKATLELHSLHIPVNDISAWNQAVKEFEAASSMPITLISTK